VRVVFRGQVFEAELADLAVRRGLDFFSARDDDELLGALSGADALWITPTFYKPALPRAIDANRGSLKWIGLTSAGYDVLLRAGVPADVAMTYAVTVHGPAVAEHAVALLLAIARQFPRAAAAQASRTWDFAAINPQLRSLEDLTVAIVGFGAIGGGIAERLRPMCKRILGVSRSGKPDPRADAMFPHTRIHEALAQADAVAIAVTFNDETHHLIDAAALHALPAGSLLVNVSRGGVVDSVALREALATGHIAGAGLDVTDPEPLPADDPLWQMPGVLITPHVGSFGSRATGKRLADQYERNLERFARGEELEGTIRLR
jgi:phosphoglycerate dehydrogenase-like enzyme